LFKDPTFLIIKDLNLYWHGLLVAAALGIGMAVSCHLRKKQSADSTRDMLIAFMITLPVSFIGARTYYCWCKPENFSGFSQIISFGNGGYGLLGGIAGAVIGLFIASVVLHIKAGELLDVCAPGMGIAISIGRWGAVFTGENLGGAVSAELFQCMPFAMYSESEGIYRKAFFAAGSLITFLLTLAVIWLFNQRYLSKTLENKSGDIFMLFISVYFMLQGIFEQYRFDPLYFNTPYIQKLQTVSATFSLGALIGAIPMAVMILRNLFKKGFKLKYLWHIAACGLLFFGYFNIVLRVESYNENLNGAVLVFCAIGLSLISVLLFIDSATWENTAKSKNPSSFSDADDWYTPPAASSNRTHNVRRRRHLI